MPPQARAVKIAAVPLLIPPPAKKHTVEREEAPHKNCRWTRWLKSTRDRRRRIFERRGKEKETAIPESGLLPWSFTVLLHVTWISGHVTFPCGGGAGGGYYCALAIHISVLIDGGNACTEIRRGCIGVTHSFFFPALRLLGNDPLWKEGREGDLLLGNRTNAHD